MRNRNLFPGEGIESLLKLRERVNASRFGGSQTHVGIAPGIFHEFKELTQEELGERLDEIDYALHLLDPDTYPDPYDRPAITRVNFSR